MRFRLSKIYSLDFIGKKTLEFTVSADYAAALIQKVRSYPFLTVHDKVNPEQPIDKNASEQVKTTVRNAYTERLQRAFAATKRPELAAYFKDLASESNIALEPLPVQPNPILAADSMTVDNPNIDITADIISQDGSIVLESPEY
ncbi:hypothetical protein BB561_006786 [Smittium simulii]|uniref:Uncharacterized protein n=1 Tax=Smittium simulii TaxID=133385 RepID=A0A2T9Y1L5_9FUNG|nr:hypothetical protein BB561_006786 [Smittium simulii]